MFNIGVGVQKMQILIRVSAFFSFVTCHSPLTYATLS